MNLNILGKNILYLEQPGVFLEIGYVVVFYQADSYCYEEGMHEVPAIEFLMFQFCAGCR